MRTCRSRRCSGSSPEGNYTIAGPAQENGKSIGRTSGTAWLTHDIPAGPKLVSPAEGATVPVRGVVARWKPVSRTITGAGDDHRLPADRREGRRAAPSHDREARAEQAVTSIAVPNGFLHPHTAYKWEVLAIERSGNQTLSSGSFRTR